MFTVPKVQAMRDGGTAGAEIVAALEAGSATFAGKTEFSQEKYRKRKAKKYQSFATLHRPTARSVCEVATRNLGRTALLQQMIRAAL